MPDVPAPREEFEDGVWVGDWFVEPMRNRVRRDDEEVQLEPKVMEVLLCLAQRPGKTVTKDRFMEQVWRETIVTDDVLSRCISQLRKVFDDDPKDPAYIETIRKTGYRLVASVEEADAASSSDITAGSADESTGLRVDPALRQLAQGVKARVPVALWEAVFGKMSPRTQGLVLTGLLGLILMVGVIWVTSGEAGTNQGPLPAVPFTSFSGEELDPSLSRVGHQVAFAWRKPDSPTQSIYLLQRGAGEPLRLSADSTTDWSPTWSRDGRFVAYVEMQSGTHRIAIVPSIGGRPTRTLSLPRRKIHGVAWMPDTTGRRLIVSVQRRPHQAFALARHNPDTDSLAFLTDPPHWSTGDTDPAPSPDGSRIAFVRGTVQGVEDVFVMPTAGGTPTQLTTDSTAIDGITWTADGSDILYTGERNGISGLWRVSADGGTPTLVRAPSAGTRVSHPTVSPQSGRLVYTQKSAQLDIWKLSRASPNDGYTASPLISSTQADTHPSIAPNGKRVAYVSDRSGTSEIWIAGADGSEPDRLTSMGGPQVTTLRWSPDGNRICFVARRNGQSDLHLISASGGLPTHLTNASSEDLVPRWSGDSRWVYFSSNRTGQWEAWRARASSDSVRVQQVTDGGAVSAQESPTDSTLYFVRPDTVGIWSARLRTSRLPIDTRVLPIRIIGQFNPDERRSWWVGPNRIHFLHRQSGSAVLVYHELDSGRIRPLYQFPDWRPVQSLDVSPNGDWFAYTHVVQRESDVMLVDNFR